MTDRKDIMSWQMRLAVGVVALVAFLLMWAGVALATDSIPFPGMSSSNSIVSESSVTATSAVDSKGNIVAMESTEAALTLDLQHAVITISGQTESNSLVTYKVPADKDLTFTPEAISGYKISEIKAQSIESGSAVELTQNSDGSYTIAADDVADGVKIIVKTNGA